MMQGDGCNLGISLRNSAGTPVEPADVREVEIVLGRLRKTYGAGELTWFGGVWLFPLSQGESFGVSPGPLRAQVRVVWANGVVEGTNLYGITVEESISKEVL